MGDATTQALKERMEAVRAEARQLLDAYGLKHWDFGFDGARRRCGICRHGSRRIELSAYYVLMNDDAQVRDTILHEIAHALAGPRHGHDATWRQVCLVVGAQPERLCHDAEMPQGRYRAVCPSCQRQHSRHHRPRGTYWCRSCGRVRGALTWTDHGRQS